MRTTSVTDICCPKCGKALQLDTAILNPTIVTAAHEQEIKEGFLFCKTCTINYPIIAGVAILVATPLAYIAENYTTILETAREHMTPNMLNYIREGSLNLLGREGSTLGASGTRQALSRYIFAHYDDSLHYLPTSHPIRQMIGDSCRDWYGQLLDLAHPYFDSRESALDLGCNVGGLAYRLAQKSKSVYGVDYSFAAIIAARGLLLSHPVAQNSYQLHIEGTNYERRFLQLDRPTNLEFLVSSVLELPFRDSSFDIVTAANLIDIVPAPTGLLKEAHRVMSTGGTFVNTTPYFWQDGFAPIDEWIDGRLGLNCARAMKTEISRYFRLLTERDLVPWLLRRYERDYTIHLNHHIVARKV